ncbi:MAG: hypothetical protein DMD64_06615 [Gemmatimonadetes bacterium]|nr:MAG: hypothetical protein DMD64_06615 [Gemmatimonadota bacterium]
MKLSDTAIRRPVLASMLSAALVLFGVIGYTRLSVRELPDIDPPVISVTTVLPGANAQVVETAVTDVLEEELSTIQGIRTLSSTSSEQTSNITLEFTLDRPVRQGVARARPLAGRCARAGDRQAVGGRPAVLLARALERQLRLDAALRRGRPARESAAAESGGRRQRPALRRAALLDARVG